MNKITCAEYLNTRFKRENEPIFSLIQNHIEWIENIYETSGSLSINKEDDINLLGGSYVMLNFSEKFYLDNSIEMPPFPISIIFHNHFIGKLITFYTNLDISEENRNIDFKLICAKYLANIKANSLSEITKMLTLANDDKDGNATLSLTYNFQNYDCNFLAEFCSRIRILADTANEIKSKL